MEHQIFLHNFICINKCPKLDVFARKVYFKKLHIKEFVNRDRDGENNKTDTFVKNKSKKEPTLAWNKLLLARNDLA